MSMNRIIKIKLSKLIISLTILGSLIIIPFGTIAQFQIGHTSITFQDPSRGNRSIPTEIYYPSSISGDNVPVINGEHPVIVFGHGFVMAWDAYQNLWEEIVPKGYIMVFPKTEGSFVGTNHQAFGWDLQFLVTKMQMENQTNSSIFYLKVAKETALMGHSMGGGAAFLAADSLCRNNNPNLKGIIGLAPAESSTNGVSSIKSAKNINIPALVLSGSKDGVTPPNVHHIPMYDSLSSTCKTFISILGGAHCYFAKAILAKEPPPPEFQ
jgi:predicted dienelactone hydrolase